MMQTISAQDFASRVASGHDIELIDVRTPAEFREVHVAFARNTPLDRLNPQEIQAARSSNTNAPLYVICRSGARGRQACQKLLAAGISNVVNVEGGTLACASTTLPIVRGKKTIPLNCQVQIITGVTVVLGSVLAILQQNFHWISLPIIMGAGLAFSGLTNTCVMGTFLARMPWNQVSPQPVSKPDSNNPPTDDSQPCSKPTSGCCC